MSDPGSLLKDTEGSFNTPPSLTGYSTYLGI